MKPYFRYDGKTNDGPTKLSVITISGAFYLLLVGLSLASVTFLCECLFAVYYSNKKRFKVITLCCIPSYFTCRCNKKLITGFSRITIFFTCHNVLVTLKPVKIYNLWCIFNKQFSYGICWIQRIFFG